MEDGIVSDAGDNDPNGERIGNGKLDVWNADRILQNDNAWMKY
jgi:hypothetical protein